MKRFLVVLLSVAAILVGCSSFNNSFNTYPPSTVINGPPAEDNDDASTPPTQTNNNGTTTTPSGAFPPVSQNTIDTGSKTVEASIHITDHPCAVDPFPIIAKTPELPYKELKAAGNDPRQLELVERQHIEVLRSYISNMKRTQNKAKLDFLAKCNTSAKK